VDSTHLKPEQAERLGADVRRHLRYLNRLCERMTRLGLPRELGSSGNWWIADMENCEFGTTSGSVRRGDKVLIDLSRGMSPDTAWMPFKPDTYDHWWHLVNEKHHVTELLSWKP
jgi:hypothetical protein